MDSLFDHVAFDDTPHVTNASGSFAVITQTGFNTWILHTITNIINRRGIVFDSGHGGLYIRSNFIHTDH